MRISDWSSDVCSSDLSAITVRDGVITELRLAKDSLYANLTSLCRGARTAAIWEVSRCTRSIGALRRNTGSYKTMTAPDRKSTSELQSLMRISYAVFCLKKKQPTNEQPRHNKLIQK